MGAGRRRPDSGTSKAAWVAPDRAGNADGAVAFNGTDSALVYTLPFFPQQVYTLSAWVYPEDLSRDLQQIASAWCRSMDDPLRLCIDHGALAAQIEAGNSYSTQSIPLEPGRWYHVAMVKDGARLVLYLDGEPVGHTTVPVIVHSSATDLGIGFNPHYSGGERFQGRIDDLHFWARAATADEIKELAAEK